jgi:Protein of unknown function (DUF5672)
MSFAVKVFFLLVCVGVVVWLVRSRVCEGIETKKALVRSGAQELVPFIRSLSLPRDPNPPATVLLTGVMIEPRDHVNLLPVIENVKQVLPGITLYIFHGTQNQETLKRRYEHDPRIVLYNMNVANLTIHQYNHIMTHPDFWRALTGEHVLVFQTDSVLFSQSQVNLYDFLQYDYVGAPWTWGNISQYYAINILTFQPLRYTPVGNGGLSLRRRTTMIEATSKYPHLSQPFDTEDVYFSFTLHAMGANMPTAEVAARLFFETIESDELPLGAHKVLPKKNEMKITAEERGILANYK